MDPIDANKFSALRQWVSPGPVSTAFMKAASDKHLLNGPVGSGKTRTLHTKHLLLAAKQPRSPIDGIRRYKATIIRDTYRNLWRSTLPTWWKIIPKEVGAWTGGRDDPASHHLRIGLPDGSILDFVMEWVAIGDNAAEEVLRGYEPTVASIDEADLIAEDVIPYLTGRVGRYPDMAHGGPAYRGIVMTCNAPEFDTWLHNMMLDELVEGVSLFRQPSGLSPDAENLSNLPAGYYEMQAASNPKWYVDRFVRNIPGYNRAGKPVISEFVDSIHVAQRPLEADPRLKLIIGADTDLHPAAVIRQHTPFGQRRILAELCPPPGTGATRFGNQLALLLAERFPGWKPENIIAGADPSSFKGADTEGGEKHWSTMVYEACGIRFRPAGPASNNFQVRREAVSAPMERMIDGAPGYVICPTVKTLRKAYNGGYHWMQHKEVRGNSIVTVMKPNKNDYSHVADADQYAELIAGGWQEISGRKARRANAVRQRRAVGGDWPDEYGPGRGRQTFAETD